MPNVETASHGRAGGIDMAQTSAMPKSIHGDIPVDAVGEALLQHYNVGITNPWFRVGLSDQETYNRRKLPWAGKSYTVEGGSVSGPTEGVPQGLQDMWTRFASEARNTINGPYDNLEDLHEDLTNMSP